MEISDDFKKQDYYILENNLIKGFLKAHIEKSLSGIIQENINDIQLENGPYNKESLNQILDKNITIADIKRFKN